MDKQKFPGGVEFLEVLNRVIRYKPKNWKKTDIKEKVAKKPAPTPSKKSNILVDFNLFFHYGIGTRGVVSGVFGLFFVVSVLFLVAVTGLSLYLHEPTNC